MQYVATPISADGTNEILWDASLVRPIIRPLSSAAWALNLIGICNCVYFLFLISESKELTTVVIAFASLIQGVLLLIAAAKFKKAYRHDDQVEATSAMKTLMAFFVVGGVHLLIWLYLLRHVILK